MKMGYYRIKIQQKMCNKCSQNHLRAIPQLLIVEVFQIADTRLLFYLAFCFSNHCEASISNLHQNSFVIP